MREKGAQWLVTLGLVHHWARRQVSPTSLAFGESSSWPFGVKVAPNGGSLGHPVGCKVLEKRAPHPYGARSEAIWRVYLGTRDTVRAK